MGTGLSERRRASSHAPALMQTRRRTRVNIGVRGCRPQLGCPPQHPRRLGGPGGRRQQPHDEARCALPTRLPGVHWGGGGGVRRAVGMMSVRSGAAAGEHNTGVRCEQRLPVSPTSGSFYRLSHQSPTTSTCCYSVGRATKPTRTHTEIWVTRAQQPVRPDSRPGTSGGRPLRAGRFCNR